MTVKQLKAFLKARGQPVCGKKEELVSRALGCIDLGVQIGGERDVSAGSTPLCRTFDLLITPTGQRLPHPDELRNWTDAAQSDFPSIHQDVVYNYIVLNRHRTVDCGKMAADRTLQKASIMAREGHVHNLLYSAVAEDVDHGFFKASVMPSLPSKDALKTPDYLVWICLSKVTGHVHSAQCGCTAG